MNNVSLIGNVTRDPEVRYTTGDKPMAVAKFSLAVQREGKDKGADFINCVAFGKAAELIDKYIAKGSKLGISGKWQTGNYESKDGKKVYTNECLVERVEFLNKVEKPESNSIPDGFSALEDDVPF